MSLLTFHFFYSKCCLKFLFFHKLKKKAPVDGKTEPKKKIKEKEKEATEKDIEVNVSLLNIQVGLIRSAQKHPSADRYFYFT